MSVILKQIKSKKGQAVVEYVLILTAVVLIMLALMKPFSEGLRDWSYSVFNYYICLLTSGSLPGGNPQCFIEGFTYQPRDLPGSVSGGSDGSPGNGGGPPDTKGPDRNDPPGPGNTNSPSDKPHSNSQIPSPRTLPESNNSGIQMPVSTPDERGGSTRRRGKSPLSLPTARSGHLISLNDNSSSSSSQHEGGSNSTNKNSLKLKISQGGFSGYDRSYKRQGSAVYSTGYFSEEREQKIKNTPIPVSSPVQKDSSFQVKKRQLFKAKKNTTKVKNEEIKGWNFSFWLRMLLIVCFLLALFLVIGSQGRQVQKSLQ